MSDNEQQFLNQSSPFLKAALAEAGVGSLDDLPLVSKRPAVALEPVVIDDFRSISVGEREALQRAYEGEFGVAYFLVRNPDDSSRESHRLFDIASQLKGALPLLYPLPHPLEEHPEARKRFGPADGTVKIYDLPLPKLPGKYREQAETSELFALHHDGLGSGGTVETVLLYADSPPLFGGYTFFQNVVRISLDLARIDPAAFEQLFLPDALTISRPRGKGAIRVVTPVLFLNELDQPQSFYRVASGEYTVSWKSGRPDLDRAKAFLLAHSLPFSYGSTFLHFSARGHGCLIRNQAVAHGRTAFVDPENVMPRCLSRKWYMRSERDSMYKHVPGMFISPSYGHLYPNLFGSELLEGEWRYDASSDSNTRIA